MKLDEFKKDLEILVNQHSLDSEFNLPNFAISDYIMDSLNALMKVNRLKPQSDGVDDFIERMYAIYPSRCPKRNASLGKTKKDKERIRKLLKCYSMDEIERVFKHEIEEKYDKQYMQNFSTFLNNFPDPSTLDNGNLFGVLITEEPNSYKEFNGSINIGGQIYR
jgi:hypothetical protein